MNPFDHLQTASSELMEGRELLDRVDTKFILSTRELPTLLSRISGDDYCAVRHAGGTHFEYGNLYFDTPQRSLLRAHHRGKRPRYKVRLRHHRTRELSFFELKQKRPNGATAKHRLRVPVHTASIGTKEAELLSNHRNLHGGNLVPSMEIDFQRAMVIGINTTERISIDTAIRFAHGTKQCPLNDLAIIEVKQPRFAARSPIMIALRAQRALQLRVSKYMTGAQLLWPDIRLNLHRHRLRMLRRRIAS